MTKVNQEREAMMRQTSTMMIEKDGTCGRTKGKAGTDRKAEGINKIEGKGGERTRKAR
jgi:hypothetical protein